MNSFCNVLFHWCPFQKIELIYIPYRFPEFTINNTENGLSSALLSLENWLLGFLFLNDDTKASG